MMLFFVVYARFDCDFVYYMHCKHFTINFLAKNVKALNMYAYKVVYFILLNSFVGYSWVDWNVVNIHLQK